MKMRKIGRAVKEKLFLMGVSLFSGLPLPLFAADSPLPISTTEEAQSGQGIIQLLQGMLDNEIILFIVIFFAIVVSMGSLGGAYNAFKKFEEDEKLSNLIVRWIVCAIFFAMSAALLYVLYAIKGFTG